MYNMKYFTLQTKVPNQKPTFKMHWIKHPEVPSEELLKKYIAEDEEIYKLIEIDNPEQWFKTLNV